MNVTISFPAETEAKLIEQAASEGKDVTAFVRDVVEQMLAGRSGATDAAELPYEQWLAAFDAWIASHKPVDHFVDDGRDSIYFGRGE